jgi:hypothetical protein
MHVARIVAKAAPERNGEWRRMAAMAKHRVDSIIKPWASQKRVKADQVTCG